VSWIEKYPKRKTGNDLIGIRLIVNSEKPPKDTGFKGMKEVIVHEASNTSKAYRLFATTTDIDQMVEAYRVSKPFTYRKTADSKYAKVQIVEG